VSLSNHVEAWLLSLSKQVAWESTNRISQIENHILHINIFLWKQNPITDGKYDIAGFRQTPGFHLRISAKSAGPHKIPSLFDDICAYLPHPRHFVPTPLHCV
jgi:hypothetical protein